MFCGCFDRVAGGAGIGNPPQAEVSIALEAKSSATVPLAKASNGSESVPALGGPLYLRDSAGTSITLTGIEIQVAKIEFSRPDSVTCEDGEPNCLEHEIGLNGNFTMDLITAKSSPAIGILKIPSGIYGKIGLNPAPADSLPGSMRPRYNFLLSGKTGAVGAERPFVMEIDLEEGLDFTSPTGIRIVKDSLTAIRLSLNVDGWFAGVDLRACMDGIPADSSGATLIRESGFCAGAVGRVGANAQNSEEVEDQDEFEQ
jgi:hypothetical protein